MIEFNLEIAQLIGILSGIVIPVLVGLVTRYVTHSGIKAGLLAGLSFGINLLTELGAALANGTAYNLGAALLAGLGTVIVAVSLHYGIYKPTGVSDVAQRSLIK